MNKLRTCVCLWLMACMALPTLARGEVKYLQDNDPERAKWRALRQNSTRANATAQNVQKTSPPQEKGTWDSAKDSLSVTPRYDSSSMSGGVSAGMNIPVTLGGTDQTPNATKKVTKPADPVKMNIRPEGTIDSKGKGSGGGVGITVPF